MRKDFVCPVHGNEFEAEWDYTNTSIVCPCCEKTWAVDFDEDFDGSIIGPWIVKEL